MGCIDSGLRVEFPLRILPAGGGSRLNSARDLAIGSSSSRGSMAERIADGPVGAGLCDPKAELGLANAEGGRILGAARLTKAETGG